jgi:hypothetical protein
MKRVPSSYDPPRARNTNRLWYVWFELRRTLELRGIQPCGAIHLREWLLGLACPGYTFTVLGWKKLGMAIRWGYLFLLLLFVVTLGYPVSNLAFGLMLAAHAISVIQLLLRGMRPLGFATRGALALFCLFALYVLVYEPAVAWFTSHWAMPLRLEGRVLVIDPRVSAAAVRPGDLVAYRLGQTGGAGYYFRGGFGIDKVLAGPGDEVVFLPGQFEVNGNARAPLPWMPDQGRVRVPEKQWLIWPRVDMVQTHGNPTNLAAILLQAALVPERQLVGKPYDHWFGRRQLSP